MKNHNKKIIIGFALSGAALVIGQLNGLRLAAQAQAAQESKATAADKAVAQSLFQRTEQFKKLAQSYAQLSIDSVQEKVLELPGLARHKKLINQALTKEVEMAKKGYAVFYTAVPYMRMFQDIVRKMYKAVHGKVGALQEKAFQFIRYTHNDPVYTQYSNVTDFLIKEIEKEGIIDDNLIRLKTILVSTNLAFFGNAGFTGESTYHYFNNPQPWASANPDWLKAALISYGYSSMFVEDLMALVRGIVTDTGDLFQIFIPLSMVDDIGYLSWRQGIPFDVPFIEDLFGRPNMHFDRSDHIYAAEINNKIAEFKKKYQEGDPGVINMVDYLLRNVEMGLYRLTPFFKLYKTGKLPFMNFYQARLLIGQWLLDPIWGLKVYRYSSLDEERESLYKVKLNKIFDRMEQDRRERLQVQEAEQEMSNPALQNARAMLVE